MNVDQQHYSERPICIYVYALRKLVSLAQLNAQSHWYLKYVIQFVYAAEVHLKQ